MPTRRIRLTVGWNDYPEGCELEVSHELAAKLAKDKIIETETPVKLRQTKKVKLGAHGADTPEIEG